MNYIDLRKLDPSELKQMRSQIVRLKKLGKSGKEIEEITGVRQNRISEIWTTYQRDGETTLKPKKRGRRHGSGTKLTGAEAAEVRRALINKDPNQLKLQGCLWTREKISTYIWQTYKKRVPVRSVSNYLKRWGFTCQRPTKRACGQDIARVEKFKREEYPAIAKRAKEEKAIIYWGDETGVTNRENYERGFAERGHTPVLYLPTKKEHVNMISAITNQGHVRFMIYEDSMNQQRLIDFMKRLISDSKQKIYFILDNLRVHHGKIVKKWLEEHKEKIEVFYIPPYSPELNPDEYLNHALKRDVHSGALPVTKSDIKHKVRSFMYRLQRNAASVTAFFAHKNVSYI